MDPLLKGLLWFLPGVIILILISLFAFDEDGRMKDNAKHLKRSLWKARGGIFLLMLVFFALQIENLVHDLYEPGYRVTGWFYSIEGVSHVVWLQNTFNSDMMVHFSSVFYILGLSFFVSLIPPFFILRNEIDLFEEFSKALAVNYIFLLLGYFSLHVMVTSYYRPEVQALAYDIPQYRELILLTNRQTNCFPSGHISLPFSITLIALYSAKLKRLAIVGAIFTLMTAFVVIYLGIHWLLDIPAGIAVAVVAYWTSSTGKIDPIFQRLMDFFKNLTESMMK
ncbi:MAG: phosphatase PAP2 family protein [Candidatus Aenigmatarchaeota archaeon]